VEGKGQERKQDREPRKDRNERKLYAKDRYKGSLRTPSNQSGGRTGKNKGGRWRIAGRNTDKREHQKKIVFPTDTSGWAKKVFAIGAEGVKTYDQARKAPGKGHPVAVGANACTNTDRYQIQQRRGWSARRRNKNKEVD